MGLKVGRHAADVPKKGNYSSLLAWRKERVKTIYKGGLVFNFPFLSASRAE